MFAEDAGDDLAIQARLQFPDKCISVTQFLPKDTVRAIIAKIFRDPVETASGLLRSNHPDFQVKVIISSDFARACAAECIKENPTLSLPENPTIGATDLDEFLTGDRYGESLINVRAKNFFLLI